MTPSRFTILDYSKNYIAVLEDSLNTKSVFYIAKSSIIIKKSTIFSNETYTYFVDISFTTISNNYTVTFTDEAECNTKIAAWIAIAK